MHSIVTGEYTKHARTAVNPRIALRDIIEADMKGDRTKHFRALTDKIFDGIDKISLEDEANDLLEAVINSWFSSNYPSVLQDAENRQLATLKKSTKKRDIAKVEKIEAKRLAAQAARTARIASVSETVVKETDQKLASLASGIRTVILLDTVTLPDGKKLRDATGVECGAAGGMLSKISAEMEKRGVSSGKVGDNLTEAQVKKMLKLSSK